MKKVLKNWVLNPIKVLLYSVALLAIIAIGVIIIPILLVVGLIMFAIGVSASEVYGKSSKFNSYF